jgi:hypothetical protein
MDLSDRFRIWRRELWGPWFGALSGIIALAANWDRFANWFGYSKNFGLANYIGEIHVKTWFTLWCLLTIAVTLERLYHVALKRDGLEADAATVRSNQDLSDFLSDMHEHGVHELLNKPPANFLEVPDWSTKEAAFTAKVLKRMKDSGCTKQECRHVHTIGLVQVMPLSPNPGIAHQLSMLVIRLGRIADIAGKYGE